MGFVGLTMITSTRFAVVDMFLVICGSSGRIECRRLPSRAGVAARACHSYARGWSNCG